MILSLYLCVHLTLKPFYYETPYRKPRFEFDGNYLRFDTLLSHRGISVYHRFDYYPYGNVVNFVIGYDTERIGIKKK